jgi:GMP synthase-like glutamine amidotransferase
MHSPGGIAGHLEQLCRLRHIPHEVIPVYRGKDLSHVKATHIVALGGDEELCHLDTALSENPWLRGEIQFIRNHIKEDRPVLGICLGAQLMAVALGIKVEHQGQQFGWTEVDVLDTAFLDGLEQA